MTSLSFQNRIAVAALITAVAVLLAASMLFMAQQWRTEHAHFVQAQGRLARVVASAAAPAMEARDASELQRTVDSLGADPRVRSARIVDLSGRYLAKLAPSEFAAEPVKADVATTVPIVRAGRTLGRLEVHSASEGLAALLPRFISMGGALFFVAAGLALFVGRGLASQLARPVARLSEAMHEVAGGGDFARRVERRSDDELGRLTDSFNDLLAQLHKNDLELRAAMSDLVEARDAAEAANVLKSHFLANMSHEIRTPLNGVLTMAQIMAAAGDLAPDQRERLEVIRQSGETLLTVLNDILDLSKIEAGRMELEDVEFDTGELARRMEAIHGPAAAKKGLAFSVNMTAKAGGVRRGDPARLQQILNNLVSNAVKFTSIGEVRVVVDGEGDDGESGLRITITDTGIGVPTDKLESLFQKFSQVDSSTTRKFGGTGLGLAICRELAQIMGGSVWAESIEGVGSTFFVIMPALRVGAAAVPARVPSASAPTEDADGDEAASDGPPLRILAAEDNPTNQLVLRTVMSMFGLEVEIVSDGAQAVEAWSNSGYDLILMDIQMPVMDGITATKTIRATEAREGRPRTPIIALSANAMNHQVEEYLAAGMDMHVAKPIDLAKLREALSRVLSEGEEAGLAAKAMLNSSPGEG
jgi:signal transduction histidine kinase/AmiR/NasT family two-component response regulator